MQQKSQLWLRILRCDLRRRWRLRPSRLHCPRCLALPASLQLLLLPCGESQACLIIRWRVDRHKTPHNCGGFRAPAEPYAGPLVKKLGKHGGERAHALWSRNCAAENLACRAGHSRSRCVRPKTWENSRPLHRGSS